jgi:cell division GTPase FtsZ
MTATSKTEMEEKNMTEEVKDDVSDLEVKQPEAPVDEKKLAALKAKSAAKAQESKMAAKIVAKKERSLQFGIVGSGQCGSRLAEAFYNLGYAAVVCNTTLVDLKGINIPDANKLLLEQHIGGAAKELQIGHSAAISYKGEILQLVNDKLADSQVNIFCTSLGGGSGAGSAETMVEVLNEVGRPVIVIAALPMDSEDSQTKSNALTTLSKLANLAQNNKISNLIVVDNAKLEAIYADVSPMSFFNVANKAIVEPLDVFNTLSSTPSATKGLDEAEFTKLLLGTSGLTVYGELSVDNFEEETSLAEAVINNMNNNLLAGGFDLKQSAYVGVLFVANKDVWAKIPNASINYALAMVNDACGSPKNIFKGIYETNMPENVVKVYSLFSGLLLPDARIEQLKAETKELNQKAKVKDENRSLNLKIDTGTEANVSAAQKIKDKIASQSSSFGKLMGGGKIDRRK